MSGQCQPNFCYQKDDGTCGDAGAPATCNCPDTKACLAYIESEGGVTASPCMLNTFHMICVQKGPKGKNPCPQDQGKISLHPLFYQILLQSKNDQIVLLHVSQVYLLFNASKLADKVLLLRQTTDGFGNGYFDRDGTEQYGLNEDDCDAPNYSAIGNATNLDRFRRDGIHNINKIRIAV